MLKFISYVESSVSTTSKYEDNKLYDQFLSIKTSHKPQSAICMAFSFFSISIFFLF